MRVAFRFLEVKTKQKTKRWDLKRVKQNTPAKVKTKHTIRIKTKRAFCLIQNKQNGNKANRKTTDRTRTKEQTELDRQAKYEGRNKPSTNCQMPKTSQERTKKNMPHTHTQRFNVPRSQKFFDRAPGHKKRGGLVSLRGESMEF